MTDVETIEAVIEGSYFIDIEVFLSRILILPNQKSLDSLVKHYPETGDLVDGLLSDNTSAITAQIFIEGGWILLIALLRNSVSDIYHEALHAVHIIMDNKGIPINKENTEVQAYLQGYIAKLILDHKEEM